jgi:hypothetical protein
MLKPIGTIPQGFLYLLGLKDRGVNPSGLQEEVTPIVDLGEFWKQRLAKTNEGLAHSVVVTTAGFNFLHTFTTNPLAVPSDEMWFVHEFNVVAVTPAVAADRVDAFRGALIYNPTNNLDWAGMGEATTLISSGGAEGAASCAKNFWAGPGMQFGIFAGRLASVGGITFTADYRATKLKI